MMTSPLRLSPNPHTVVVVVDAAAGGVVLLHRQKVGDCDTRTDFLSDRFLRGMPGGVHYLGGCEESSRRVLSFSVAMETGCVRSGVHVVEDRREFFVLDRGQFETPEQPSVESLRRSVVSGSGTKILSGIHRDG
ncbi:hypothetical protein CEXT_414511 [Caerostris extrusa]|uniref:Uncharacterized protein n=1 Tax=Caerostris extrusa TaxID=172846 RepID=A0AAV4U7G2_CAEEX|nr:hypothetical protein CEXT_414511 [Caerostris extrusa]